MPVKKKKMTTQMKIEQYTEEEKQMWMRCPPLFIIKECKLKL